MPRYIHGIEMSASGVKIATVEVALRGVAVKKVQTEVWAPTPAAASSEPGAAAALTTRGATLRALSGALTQGEIYVGLDGTRVATRVLQFPVADLKKLDPMIGFELEDLLPRGLDDIVYGWLPIELTRTHGTVLIGSTAKSDVRSLLDDLGDAAPRAVLCEALAYLWFLPSLGDVPAAQQGVIIDLGHARTHVLLIHAGKPLFARTLREGGARLDRALALAFQLSEEEARRGKEDAGRIFGPGEAPPTAEAKKVSDTLIEALRPLVVGIRQTLQPTKVHFVPKQLYLTGGQSLLPGLAEHLGRELGMDARPLPLPPGLAEFPDGHRYTLSYALAASGSASSRQPRLDFRKGEFSFRGDLSQLRGHAARLGWAVAAVAVLAIFSALARYVVLRADERKLDRSLREVTRTVMGREIGDFKQALAAMKQSIAPEKSPIPKYSAVDHFAIVSARIPADLDLHADDLEFRPDKILIKGDAPSFETVDKVVDDLRGHACFKTVTLAKSRKTSDGTKVEFNISIDLGCGT